MSDSKTILFYTSKPFTMRFGGDDNFLIELIAAWPSPQDRLILVVNAGHPCRDIFAARLAGRAELRILSEELLIEKRAHLAQKGYPAGVRNLCEWLIDLARPIRFLGALSRLRQFLNGMHPDVLLVTSGGNPPNDLTWRMLVAAKLNRIPRTVLSLHSLPGKGTNWLRSAGIALLRRLTPSLCDDIVCLAESNGRVLADSMGTRKPFICIPNGINPQDAPRRSVDEMKRDLGLIRGPQSRPSP